MMIRDVEVDDEYLEQIDKARIDLQRLISSKRCAPIMLRLAWQDAATYEEGTRTGGPNGSLRFEEEYCHPLNNGLKLALDLCEEVKSKYPKITYADLYQLAGVVAVEVAGGPKITFTPGRTDSTSSNSEWRKLPRATADADHLRLVFYRMGLSDREIVLLSGAHTLGRAHPNCSGYDGPWTNNPSKFDNSYFVALIEQSEGLLRLPSDDALIQDPILRRYVRKYAQDIDSFFQHYAVAHRKFSELGYTVYREDIVTNSTLLWLTASVIVIGASMEALNYLFSERPKKGK